MSGRKEDNISAKILDSIVSGLNDEPDQETTAPEIGKRNASFSLIPPGYDTKQSMSVLMLREKLFFSSNSSPFDTDYLRVSIAMDHGSFVL